jgi:hypothetical protein
MKINASAASLGGGMKVLKILKNRCTPKPKTRRKEERE